MMPWTVRPLGPWLGPSITRRDSSFKSTWFDTLTLLDREISQRGDPAIAGHDGADRIVADTDSQIGRCQAWQPVTKAGDAAIPLGAAQPRRCDHTLADAHGEQGPQLPPGRDAVWDRLRADPARRDRDGWWATEPDVGRVAHGVPARVDRLRALGNAVVPQVAEHIGRMILTGAGYVPGGLEVPR